MDSVHFSSASDEWSTPDYVWRFMQHIAGKFELDAAATKDNAICKHFLGPGSVLSEDALNVRWLVSPVWCNPPYSQVEAFMQKALHESRMGGVTVVMLVPARTDTKWWHEYAAKGEVTFLRGRLKFGGQKNSAPFPSAIVIFKGKEQ